MARGQYWIHPALTEVVENALLALCGEPPAAGQAALVTTDVIASAENWTTVGRRLV